MHDPDETAPAPTPGIDSGIAPAMGAFAARIGSAHTDIDRIGSPAAIDRGIGALPAEFQEIARQHPPRPLAERRAERLVETPEEKRALLAIVRADRAAIWRSNLPPEYASASVDRLTPDQHPEAIRAWWESDSTMLLLRSGNVGNGKTFAAYAVANRFCDDLWCVAYQLSDLVQDQIDRVPDPHMWNRAVRCDLLILDDVGQESGVGWKREEARTVQHRLLSARNSHWRRTIITTNRDGAWLEGTPDPRTGEQGGYGSAVVDRMLQNARVIEFTGTSRRRTARPETRNGELPKW